MTKNVFVGFFLIVWALVGTMILEHVHFAILLAPSAWLIVFGTAVGGAIVVCSPEELRGAFSAFQFNEYVID